MSFSHDIILVCQISYQWGGNAGFIFIIGVFPVPILMEHETFLPVLSLRELSANGDPIPCTWAKTFVHLQPRRMGNGPHCPPSGHDFVSYSA